MNWNELSFNEKLACVSLFPEEAKRDEDFDIRIAYFLAHPGDEDAKKDEEWPIRSDWYERHPEDKDALKDENEGIRKMAKTYWRIKEQLGKS